MRAVVLSGEGRGFCAGLDVANFGADGRRTDADSGGDERRAIAASATALPGRITNLAQQAVYTWTELPVPVIAAVHGVALGGGIQIALGADIRYRRSRRPAVGARDPLGTAAGHDRPADAAPPRRPRRGQGADLHRTDGVGRGGGRARARHPGVGRPARDDALALAREIAGKNPAAIRGAKALLNAAGTRPLAESFLEESRLMGELIGSPNQIEAVTAYFEKRTPVFTDD